MIITDLPLQKKNKTRYSLFIDDEFICGVQDEVVLKFKLAKNKQITPDDLKKIQEEDMFILARQFAARSLAMHKQSKEELRRKLHRKEFSIECIERVIEYFLRNNYINDKEYAESFIKSKLRQKPIGKLKLKRDLMQKGISIETINNSLNLLVDDDEQKEAAMKLAEKKLKSIKDKPREKVYASLISYLKYHGISSQIAGEVIREVLNNNN